ncbi:SDR family NAD(P)-dependent oxidoreductase [Actinorugispora endophytica]|uniref:SDR family NAD(P)-dependent oxidoreductase n=1 Tax=Actinorugispora endophytica TaxID=1605990 RepID=UPI00105C25B3|nr:SDR family NAD(P)-dependent oxidoreductase [Actinorugispora endophytica]
MKGRTPAGLRSGAVRKGGDDPIPGHVGAGRLRGRRALVAGGFDRVEGPGRVLAAALAKEGAAVAVAGAANGGAVPAQRTRGRRGPTAGTRPEPGVLAAADLLGGLGAHTLPLHCEPGDETDCRKAVAHTALEFGGIDLLVVCADVPPAAWRMTDLGARELERGLRDSVFGAFWLVQAASLYMLEGSAVVLAATRRGGAEHVGYAAGAAGVMSMARSLAVPMRERGIAINGLLLDGADDPRRTAEAGLELATATSGQDTGEVWSLPGRRRAD